VVSKSWTLPASTSPHACGAVCKARDSRAWHGQRHVQQRKKDSTTSRRRPPLASSRNHAIVCRCESQKCHKSHKSHERRIGSLRWVGQIPIAHGLEGSRTFRAISTDVKNCGDGFPSRELQCVLITLYVLNLVLNLVGLLLSKFEIFKNVFQKILSKVIFIKNSKKIQIIYQKCISKNLEIVLTVHGITRSGTYLPYLVRARTTCERADDF
jgi:hypothetical protein